MHLAIEYYPLWWEDRGCGSHCFNLEVCDWAQGIVTTIENKARRNPTLYVIDTLRRPRLDGCLDICSRQLAFESVTHYYFEAKEFNDELFEETTQTVYWFATELHERRIENEKHYKSIGT
ncbi:hypothetical protein F4677DRAFT_428500 [Hypoxylon crocopeplum]|nr:hypothetical protein F4677DRAFT_428500 [Hypoxylon crocopeplum]